MNTVIHWFNFFSIKHFQPFSSLAALPPLSVRLFPVPVWSVRPSPSLWLVLPLSVSDKKQDKKNKQMKTVIFHEKQFSKRKCVHKDSLHFPPVSAGGRPPSWPELFLPRLVSAPLPPSSSSPRWDVGPRPAGALAPPPSCAPALRDTAWTHHKLQCNQRNGLPLQCFCLIGGECLLPFLLLSLQPLLLLSLPLEPGLSPLFSQETWSLLSVCRPSWRLGSDLRSPWSWRRRCLERTWRENQIQRMPVTLKILVFVLCLFLYLTSIFCCSGSCFCLVFGQAGTRSLRWILLPTFSWCPDRPGVTGREGSATNRNILLRDGWELKLQRGWMSADRSSGGPWGTREQENRCPTLFRLLCTVGIFTSQTVHLPFRGGRGGGSALCDGGRFDPGVGSSRSCTWATVWALLRSILLRWWFDLKQKEGKETQNNFLTECVPFVSILCEQRRREQVESPVPDWCFSAGFCWDRGRHFEYLRYCSSSS